MYRGYIAAILLGLLVGYAAERLNFARNGLLMSMVLGVGGAITIHFVSSLFGIPLWGRATTSLVGAAVAVFLIPALSRR